MKTNHIYTGDALDSLAQLPENAVDAIVTDPPYGLAYIGLDWDQNTPEVPVWQEVLRVLKPGGHLVAFSSARTYHHLAQNIERAGFEIRDQVMWIYGTGFPRSHNIALAIERKYGPQKAKKWRGWGTTLKPAHEPIVIARKPFKGAVVDNVLTFGTGGLNIDKCHVVCQKESPKSGSVIPFGAKTGRFPSNVMHSGIKEPWAPYFYCAKPSTRERDIGLAKYPLRKRNANSKHRGITGVSRNTHPTVKPILLMEHLITLVTPPKGIALDPFCGSGSTLTAAKNLCHPFIGIEQNFQYVDIARERLAA